MKLYVILYICLNMIFLNLVLADENQKRWPEKIKNGFQVMSQEKITLEEYRIENYTLSMMDIIQLYLIKLSERCLPS
jgi:hypothetical protein